MRAAMLSKEALHMQRVFVIGLAAVVTLAASLGAFLFFSLWPYIDVIGRVAAGVVITGLVCVAALMVSFTFSKIGIWRSRHHHERLSRRVIVAGDVVAYLYEDGTFTHLSAMHEAAKLAPAPMKEIAAPTPPDNSETVIALYDNGNSLRTIAEDTGMTYYQVQK